GTELKGVYTIPAGVPFVDCLAARLLADFGTRPEALSRIVVYLPTRRATRTLQEAFLRRSQAAALILPRMVPLGDLDEEDALVAGRLDTDAPDLAPAVPELTRRLALAELIESHSLQAIDGTKIRYDHAVKLAAELARLIDQVQTEGLSFDELDHLVPDEYAAHWQQTLDFLEVITRHWPDRLDELGFMDPAARRNLAVVDQIARWRQEPPSHPIIAAGSTGSTPATADLLVAIAALPRGAVILPGLDKDMDETSWAAIGPTHPQYSLRQLITRLGLARDQITDFDTEATGARRDARVRLLNEAQRPAATADRWVDGTTLDAGALADLARIDCADAAEEATVIALIMRRALEQRNVNGHGQTCALVTPDRALARRVAGELGRWGIAVDDSAGRPLRDTSIGTYLLLILEFVAERAAPIQLLALFKHPFAMGGALPGAFRALTRTLERLVLRGPRPAPGLAGLIAALQDARARIAAAPDDVSEHTQLNADFDRLIGWVQGIAALYRPLEKVMEAGTAPLKTVVEAHIAFAEALAAGPAPAAGQAKDEPSRLWDGGDGEAMADFVADLLGMAGIALPTHLYLPLLDTLMADRVVRPRFGTHPRLAILGPLEARLQAYDVTVLGGLNEGSWPPEPAADPWMGRHMRNSFGLPSPDRRVGLSAHDFVQASSAGYVYWTRAARVAGNVTVPSRWLVRIDALLAACGHADALAPPEHWRAWVHALDLPEKGTGLRAGTVRPAPCPPVAVRPRRLSVTDIERWMRDPYDIYAKHILRLAALDPIDAGADQAVYGGLIHRILDRFVAAGGNRLDDLIALGRDAFANYNATPGVIAFWWPRFERIAAWFVAHEAERAAQVESAHTERRGTLQIDAGGDPFTLVARADRIDRLRGGGLEIIDYKTGKAPSNREVEQGYAPQLPLEAAIARAGGFDGLAAIRVQALSYWRLTGGRPPAEINNLAAEPEALAAAALTRLCELVASFDDPQTPYLCRPRPDKAPQYSDYEHLARIQEWGSKDEFEEQA
ncbi:MAG: double-strand break repair protein AddB, partial [Alphaproteobacteria bacterium]|nr:double-strand break repair protein AddB [Alphaproteobacteria bacterium]